MVHRDSKQRRRRRRLRPRVRFECSQLARRTGQRLIILLLLGHRPCNTRLIWCAAHHRLSIHVSVGVNPCSSIQPRRFNSNHRSPSAKEPRRPPSPSRHRARLIIVFATATRIGILISRSRDEMRAAPIQGHGNSFGDRRPPSARMSRPAAKSI